MAYSRALQISSRLTYSLYRGLHSKMTAAPTARFIGQLNLPSHLLSLTILTLITSQISGVSVHPVVLANSSHSYWSPNPVNLTDPVFRGLYRGHRKHEGTITVYRLPSWAHSLRLGIDDLSAMLERSNAAGVRSMIITGTSLKESKQAIELASEIGRAVYS
jgi:hypothetical protein